jgi:hypothetical protein
MDRELALRSHRNLSLVHLFKQPARNSRTAVATLRINTLDCSFAALTTRDAQIISCIPHQLARNRRNLRSHHPGLDLNHDAQRKCNRHALRKEPALPILFVACLEHAMAALEEWTASNLDIYFLGCARVGMECLSQYEREFGGGCGFFGLTGRGDLVGIEEGLAGGQGQRAKEN